MGQSVELIPILKDLRSIYDLAQPMERYWAYVNLMTKDRGEILPLGDFSPMGARQQEFMDQLMELSAEAELAKIAGEALETEINLPRPLRMIAVVVDEPRNGWTHRALTDYSYRFGPLSQLFPSQKRWRAASFDWLPVYLWTTDSNLKPFQPTSDWLRVETRKAVHRTATKTRAQQPRTLQDLFEQELRAHQFATNKDVTLPSELSDVLKQHGLAYDQPKLFAALYGDAAAIQVGYTPLNTPGFLTLLD